MGDRITSRITRLEAQRTEIDAQIASFDGLEEKQVGPTRERYGRAEDLQRRRGDIEAQLSRLYAIQNSGGRTFLRKGRC